MPEDLPADAREFWPDLSDWPTANAIRQFVKSTRRNPEARIAVLAGLRRLSAVDMSVPWAYVGVTIPVVLALFTGATDVVWIRALLLSAAVIAFVVLIATLVNISARADERRRSALVWLRALEDALPPTRRTG